MTADPASRPGFVSASSTDFGRVRNHNEDFCIVDDPTPERGWGIYVLCDGMGGTARGDIASETAARSIHEHVHQHFQPDADAGTVLEAAIRGAQDALKAHQVHHHDTIGMGCTVVAGLLDGARLTVAHVGDSRCYLATEGELEVLTRDHSWAAELYRAGALKSEAEVRAHHQRHVLTRFLGGREPQELEVDLTSREVPVGVRALFCSDGLWDMVQDERILELVRQGEPQGAAKLLVEEANREGGRDNVTVIVVERTR